MVAIVEIREKNNVGETPTVKTSSTVRFKNADDSNVDLINPIVKPGKSYEKWLRLYIGATGPTGNISSLRIYSDGINNFGTGISLKCGSNGSYILPVNTTSTYAITDFFSYISTAPLALGTGPYTGTTHDIGDYLVMQAIILGTASTGLSPTEPLTCTYDET